MLGALTLHRYLIDFRRWELCFCSLKAMLLQTESNAPTLWNDCNWRTGAMLREHQQRKETEINGINGNDGAARANIYFSVFPAKYFKTKTKI